MRASRREEQGERILRKDLTILLHFLSRNIKTLKNKLESTYDDVTRENIKRTVEEFEYITRFKNILDNIIEISDFLLDKTLTKEEINYYTQRRNAFRAEIQEETKKNYYRRIEHRVERAKFKTTIKSRLGDSLSFKEICIPMIFLMFFIFLLSFAILQILKF